MQHTLSSLYIIIPVFNEKENLPALASALISINSEFEEKFKVRYLLVDDGSTDGTPAEAKLLFQEFDLTVIIHEKNLGPGGAFATAFASLDGELSGDDWVITMEGDNTSRQELISKMLYRSKEGFDVVLASPYMYGGGFSDTSLLRKVLSGGANLVVKDLLGIQGILTVSSFFRLYSGAAIIKLQRVYGPGILERKGFESMVELLMKLIMQNASISEISMVLDSSLRKGKSKMNIRRTILGYFSLWSCKRRWEVKSSNEG